MMFQVHSTSESCRYSTIHKAYRIYSLIHHRGMTVDCWMTAFYEWGQQMPQNSIATSAKIGIDKGKNDKSRKLPTIMLHYTVNKILKYKFTRTYIQTKK